MRGKCFTTIAMLALCASAGRSPAASAEGPLWLLWLRHLTETNHADMAAACVAYTSNPAHAELAPVAELLGSWHQLRQENRAAATARLEPLLTGGDDAVSIGCAELARAWLTRLDAARLREALHAHYLKHVSYPVRLSSLRSPSDSHVPLRDRWGRDWTYRLTGFQTLPGLHDQKYVLRSAVLQDDTDLSAAIAKPYAADIPYAPLRLVSAVAGHETWEFRTGDGRDNRVFMTVGAASGKIRLLYSGDAILILCDANYCKIVLRPEATQPQ